MDVGKFIVDCFDAERAMQGEEFLNREQENGKRTLKRVWAKKPAKAPQPEVMTFQKN